MEPITQKQENLLNLKRMPYHGSLDISQQEISQLTKLQASALIYAVRQQEDLQQISKEDLGNLSREEILEIIKRN